MGEQRSPLDRHHLIVGLLAFAAAAAVTTVWWRRAVQRQEAISSAQAEKELLAAAVQQARQKGMLWPLRSVSSNGSHAADAAARLAAASGAALPDDMPSWDQWSRSFKWGEGRDSVCRNQAVVAAEASLPIKGVSTQGLERMARIAAGIAGDLGERGLCRHSAFFAGLSEGAMQRMCSSPVPKCSPSSLPQSSLAGLTAPVRGSFTSPRHRNTSGASSVGGTGSHLGTGGSNRAAASVTAAVATGMEGDAQEQSLRSYSEPMKTGDKRKE